MDAILYWKNYRGRLHQNNIPYLLNQTLHEVYGHYRWIGYGEESQYYNTTYDQSVDKFTTNKKKQTDELN